MDDFHAKQRLIKEIRELQQTYDFYQKSNEGTAAELNKIETEVQELRAAKHRDDLELAELKNEEALLNIELNELLATNDSAIGKKLNDSLADFSVTGTEQDSERLAAEINVLTKKFGDLDSEVRTMHNDGLMFKQEIDEIATKAVDVSTELQKYAQELSTLEASVSRLQLQKKELTTKSDELRIAIAEKELNQTPKGMGRGNAGIAEYDDYIKKLRNSVAETREQKRSLELQHMEVSQRLDTKRRRREMAEKSRVTDATMTLMREIYNQLSFAEHLKISIEAFYAEHTKWAGQILEQFNKHNLDALPELKAEILKHIQKFRRLLEMTRDAICEVLKKVTPAYEAERQQYNEVQQRFQQKVSSAVANQNHGADQLLSFLQTLHTCLKSPAPVQ